MLNHPDQGFYHWTFALRYMLKFNHMLYNYMVYKPCLTQSSIIISELNNLIIKFRCLFIFLSMHTNPNVTKNLFYLLSLLIMSLHATFPLSNNTRHNHMPLASKSLDMVEIVSKLYCESSIKPLGGIMQVMDDL